MSNTSNPAGLIPHRHAFGGVIRDREYAIDSGAGSIFTGDPVKTDTGNYGNKIVAAAAGDRLLGVFAGCRYIAADGSQQFQRAWISGTAIQAGTTISALVYDDPQIQYLIQANADFEAANEQEQFNVVAAAGNALTGVSGFQLDVSSGSHTVQKQLKAVGISGTPDNAFGTSCKVLVIITNHELAAPFTGV